MTGVGKALLAFDPAPLAASAEDALRTRNPRAVDALRTELEDIRQTGVARDRNEAAAGLSCVAVPVVVGENAVLAVSVSYSSCEGDGRTFVNPLRETATALARTAAGTVGPIGPVGTGT
jgi:DNA-binding IclR family transcriptional regulator